ncbi:MAG: bifunctional (p)ppGpp synthetase/guanosine-3',5'-bis(diphosphate) 3'-pyrophosphohydrolase [Spirochaetales bacterium]|nr:bifunctional (p)ppGpp synthetase/guanosine-3',5'-bis(diphosphate) 3'-pyrophosphohydrolase [Spirochaetales bacterium]
MKTQEEIVRRFKERLIPYSDEEKKIIHQAVDWAAGLHNTQKRESGEPYIMHPLEVAAMLIDLHLDAEAIAAAVLHDVLEDTVITRTELRKRFGREIEALVNGVTKISTIRAKSKTVLEAETVRKMLFAMIKDVRVMLIKLADKLHNMRTLHFLPEDRQRRFAQECLDIYAPLAGRLGISWLKNELEDLALKHLQPDVYDQIRKWVAGKRVERAGYLAQVENAVLEESRSIKLDIKVESRAKHFYSIYQKMKRTGKSVNDIYDLFGIRILCNTPGECYELLGLVHKIWKPIEGRFKDYIAMAKSNRYQSLHTTVMGFSGRLIEIQIRTFEMHQTAENGIAAHWLYKRGFSKEIVRPEDIPLITQLKSLVDAKIASREFLDKIKQELLRDSIYVFTPGGEVVELPKGSTAIDFAFHIHTEVGSHCFAAKADGSIIPLNRELKNTQVIEIITSQNTMPHVNWLRYAKTTRARSKIRHWLNQHDANLYIDRNIVAKKKPAVHIHEKAPDTPPRKEEAKNDVEREFFDKTRVGIKSGNERNLMIRFAQCCKPMTGDAILGYVSRGRGIIVHRADCKNQFHIKDFQERIIDVEWETVSPRATKRFKVTARMSSALFSEIEGALKKYHGHLIEGRLEENGNDTLSGSFSVEIDNKEDFAKVMKSIRTIPAIMNIQPIGS